MTPTSLCGTRATETPTPTVPTPGGRRRRASIMMLVLTVVAAVLAPLFFAAPPASAVPVTGRAFGYYSSENGGFWLGSWRLADGTLAFCVNTERGTPNGAEFSYADGAALGWYSPDDAARLAYISRSWAGSTDPTTAAAGQIATWTLTGLGSHTQEELAAKAGADAASVLELARRMLDEAEMSASRSVGAALELSRDGDRSRVTAVLTADTVAAGPVVAPAGAHEGTMTLSGATFADGSTTASVHNGVPIRVRVTAGSAVADVAASVHFDGLPYGNALTMAVSSGAAQNLLTAGSASASATATVSTPLPSDLPFQPVVSTRTSAAVADEGAGISDTVIIAVEPTASTLAEWPVVGPPGGPFTTVPLTVRSRLLGPFAEQIVPAEHPPADAPVVCEVTRVITTGPGEYVTPSCTLAGPGHYVWVESISPTDTAPAEGGARILPWTSPFGVATEITTVNAPPAPPPPAGQPDVAPVPTPEAPRPEAPTLPETGSGDLSRLHAAVLALALVATGAACLRPRRPRPAGRHLSVSAGA
ncbi:hypothetical protein [Mycetocola zhujimingii]|uniref:hypothetical protein n=1 Tax=Mycetocola zhujimingii TaxID=2079792 RepID=UPI0013C42A6A|nr:hypothetical protein [Mycetocola zhujimingii]